MEILAVQGTHKSLLQHHTAKASILRHSAFFTVQLPQFLSLGQSTKAQGVFPGGDSAGFFLLT